MAKARLTVTTVYEYEIIPEHYGDEENDQQRMEYDIEIYLEDPALLEMKEAKSFGIKGEIIP